MQDILEGGEKQNFGHIVLFIIQDLGRGQLGSPAGWEFNGGVFLFTLEAFFLEHIDSSWHSFTLGCFFGGVLHPGASQHLLSNTLSTSFFKGVNSLFLD